MCLWRRLSRGALRVVCVDREPACIKNIHRNLIHLGFEDRARVIKGDVLKPLDYLLSYSDNEGYDIIFMGPPYRDQNNKMLALSEPALKNVSSAKLLAPKGVIVLQTHKTELFAVPEETGNFPRGKNTATPWCIFCDIRRA